jgi:hypothetical protein
MHEKPTRWALVGGGIVLGAVTVRAALVVRARRLLIQPAV